MTKIIGGRGKAPEPRRAMVCTCMAKGMEYCEACEGDIEQQMYYDDLAGVARQQMRANRDIWRPWED
jgi:hypothetical protein